MDSQSLTQMDAIVRGRSKTGVAVPNNQQPQTPQNDLQQMDAVVRQGVAPTKIQTEKRGILGSLTKPLTDYGKYVGEAAYQGVRFAADPTFRKSVMGGQLTPQESQYIANTPATRFLDTKDVKDVGTIAKTGIKRTAGAASYFVPMGGTLKTAIAGGAIAGGLQGLSEGDNFSLKNIGAGAAIGAALPVAFAGVGKGINLAKKGAGSLSERFTTQGLGSPSKLKKAIGLNPNESMFDLFEKNNLWDRLPQSAQLAVKNVDDAYQSAIAGSTNKVKLSEVVKKFDDAIDELSPLADQSDAVARQIKELSRRRDAFVKSSGSFKIGAEPIYRAKKAASKDLTNTAFSPSAKLKGSSEGTKKTFDIFRNQLGEVAPSTKALGREEGALLELADIFESYQSRGAGNKVISLGKIGSLGVGGLLGGLPGAIGTYIAESAISSPTGTRILAKTFNKLSKAEVAWLVNALKRAGQSGAVSATGASLPFLENRSKEKTFSKPKKVTTFSNL